MTGAQTVGVAGVWLMAGAAALCASGRALADGARDGGAARGHAGETRARDGGLREVRDGGVREMHDGGVRDAGGAHPGAPGRADGGAAHAGAAGDELPDDLLDLWAREDDALFGAWDVVERLDLWLSDEGDDGAADGGSR